MCMPDPLPKPFGASAAPDPNFTLLAAHAPPPGMDTSRAAPDEATLPPLPTGCPNKAAGAPLPPPPANPELVAPPPKAAPDALLPPKVKLGPVTAEEEAPKPVVAGIAPKLAAPPEAAPNPPAGVVLLPKAGAEDDTPKAVAGPKPPPPGAMPPPKPAAAPGA